MFKKLIHHMEYYSKIVDKLMMQRRRRRCKGTSMGSTVFNLRPGVGIEPFSIGVCGHCKKLAPEYEKLGASFKKAKSVLIAKVDCDEQKTVCTKYGVSGYPTIQWFPKGSLEPQKYEGPRNAEALAEYVNKEGGTNVKLAAIPQSVIVLTPDNFNEVFMDQNKDVLVEFYAPWLLFVDR